MTKQVIVVLAATSGIIAVLLTVAPASVPTFQIVQAGAWLWIVSSAVIAMKRPSFRAPMLLLAILTVGFTVSPPGGWFDRCCPEPGWGGSDGVFYWEAGSKVLSGENPWLGSGYLYPPPVAQFFGAMHVFSPERALGMWTWILLVSYLVCIAMTYHIAFERTGSLPIAIAATGLLWLVNRPAAYSLADHQVNLPMLALLFVAWTSFQRHKVLSATMISIGALIKIAPLTAAFFPAIIRFRWLIVFIPIFFVVLIGVIAVDPALWLLYIDYARDITGLPRGVSIDVLSLALLPATVATPVAFTLRCLLLLMAVIVVAERRHSNDAASVDVSFATAAWAMVILPPTVWSHYLVWFTPILLVCWLYCSEQWTLAIGAATVVALWMPVLPPPIGAVVTILLGVLLLLLLRSALPAAGRDEDGTSSAIQHLLGLLAKELTSHSRQSTCRDH